MRGLRWNIVQCLLLLMTVAHVPGHASKKRTYIEIFYGQNDVTLLEARHKCYTKDEHLYLPMLNTTAKILLYKTLKLYTESSYGSRTFEFWTNATSDGTTYFWDNYPSCTELPSTSNLWGNTLFSSENAAYFKVESDVEYGLYSALNTETRGMVVCEKEQESCEYIGESSNECPSQSTESSMTLVPGLNDIEKCSKRCDNFISGEAECWGYLYSDTTRDCTLFYHVNPLLLTRIEENSNCPSSYPDDIKFFKKKCHFVNFDSGTDSLSSSANLRNTCNTALTFLTTTSTTISTTTTPPTTTSKSSAITSTTSMAPTTNTTSFTTTSTQTTTLATDTLTTTMTSSTKTMSSTTTTSESKTTTTMAPNATTNISSNNTSTTSMAPRTSLTTYSTASPTPIQPQTTTLATGSLTTTIAPSTLSTTRSTLETTSTKTTMAPTETTTTIATTTFTAPITTTTNFPAATLTTATGQTTTTSLGTLTTTMAPSTTSLSLTMTTSEAAASSTKTTTSATSTTLAPTTTVASSTPTLSTILTVDPTAAMSFSTSTSRTTSLTATYTTITAPNVPSTKSPIILYISSCLCFSHPSNLTVEERVDAIIRELAIDVSQTSAMIRSKTSADDDRASSVSIGIVSIVFLIIPTVLIVMVDFSRLFAKKI